jgi:SPP1 gp7 family putative phage head morphogenesis protein
LPQSSIDIPLDLRWNRDLITSEITQGLLQGEGVGKVATRLQNVADMNRASALRNARTSITGAENAGRLATFEEAKAKGIKVKKQWQATLDGKTRHSHAALDGVSVDTDKPFPNGCMYPADPDGPPEEVYNCRCTMIADLGVESKEPVYRRVRDPTTGRNVVINDMTYREWVASKYGH